MEPIYSMHFVAQTFQPAMIILSLHFQITRKDAYNLLIDTFLSLHFKLVDIYLNLFIVVSRNDAYNQIN